MSQDIAVSEIRRRILRYWWIPVLCALIGTAVGLAAPKTVPPLYRSQATVLVGSTEGSVTHSSTIRASEDLAAFYADMARREVVLRPVVQRLNLPMRWDLLRNQVSATVPPQNLRLVQVVVVAPKQEDARKVANAIVRQLVILSPPLPGGNEQGFVNNQVQHLKTTIDDGEAEVARLKDELDAPTDAAAKDRAAPPDPSPAASRRLLAAGVRRAHLRRALLGRRRPADPRQRQPGHGHGPHRPDQAGRRRLPRWPRGRSGHRLAGLRAPCPSGRSARRRRRAPVDHAGGDDTGPRQRDRVHAAGEPAPRAVQPPRRRATA